MGKGNIEKIWFLFFFLGFLGCVGGKIEKDDATQLKLSDKPLSRLSVLWSKRASGAISEFALSRDGKVLLVASSPDADISGTSDRYLLSRINFKGTVTWQLPMKSPVKELALSEDGSFSVVSNYQDEIQGMDTRGRVLWSAKGMCKPFLLESSKKILCYHDDDGDPQTAFKVFDWRGKLLSSFPLPTGKDVLALKLSFDQRNLALGLTGGEVILLDANFQPVWQKTVEGEVIDLGVSSGESPRVAVLLKEMVQKILILDGKGDRVNTLDPAFHSMQVELTSAGDGLFYYGNGPKGQYLGSLPVPLPILRERSLASLRTSWKRGGALSIPYSSVMTLTPSSVVVGYGEASATPSSNHILAFNEQGELRWDLPVPTEDEAAYLLTYRMAANDSIVAVATDDAKLSLYQVVQE